MEKKNHMIINFIFDFCFEDDLPVWTEFGDGIVKEGDILNIETIIDLEYQPGLDDNDKKNGNNFLCTFLIELNPL